MSEAYNRELRCATLLHALLPAIQKPPAEFRQVLRCAFEETCSCLARALLPAPRRSGSGIRAHVWRCQAPPEFENVLSCPTQGSCPWIT